MNGLEHVLFEPLMAVFGQVWQDLEATTGPTDGADPGTAPAEEALRS